MVWHCCLESDKILHVSDSSDNLTNVLRYSYSSLAKSQILVCDYDKRAHRWANTYKSALSAGPSNGAAYAMSSPSATTGGGLGGTSPVCLLFIIFQLTTIFSSFPPPAPALDVHRVLGEAR